MLARILRVHATRISGDHNKFAKSPRECPMPSTALNFKSKAASENGRYEKKLIVL